ncbi:MAG: S41 family peptidase [Myxococcota bacterium]|nr:S41 family peptidase [Myxococcota bacterium]
MNLAPALQSPGGRLGALTALAALLLLGAGGPAAAEPPLSCERIPELIVHYLQKHITFHYPNDELRRRVVDSYMRKLDPAKTLYLRDEADQLEKSLHGVLLDLNDGDCKVLEAIHQDLPKRYQLWEEFVREFVSAEGYQIDPSATLVLDAEKRPRPATRDQQHALLANLAHFQMANYAVAVSSELAAEAASEAEETSETDEEAASESDETGAIDEQAEADEEAAGADEEAAEAEADEEAAAAEAEADGEAASEVNADGEATDLAAAASETVLVPTPEILEKARKKLIHRQELITQRARDLTIEDVYSDFLDAFARALDPHSNYLPQEVFEDFRIGMELSLEGIGVKLSYRDGFSVVEDIIPGGAADRVDVLEKRDKIIAVAQEGGEFVDVIDMDLRDVVRKIRGKRGTTVHLTVLRDEKERLEVSIVRDKINLEEQAASLRIEELEVDGEPFKLGLLELPSFYGDKNPSKRQSSRDVRKLLKQAKKKKVDGVMLDLSRNGGGLLDNAVEIAGLFVEEGGVVAVKDTYGKLQVMRDPDDSIAYDGPLVVMTSRVSASASEIVAGAMQDYRRAVLIGDDHTFGKGTVQSMVQLPPGLGALKVTTQLFFRPGGVSTQHEGVESDVRIPATFNVDDFGEKHQPYSLEAQQVAPFVEVESQGNAGSAWPAITDELVRELVRRSQGRVAASEEFQKIEADLAEVRERGGVVHVKDILTRDADDAASEQASADAEDDDEQPLTSHQTEGLYILADYVAVGRQLLADNRRPEAEQPN